MKLGIGNLHLNREKSKLVLQKVQSSGTNPRKRLTRYLNNKR